MAVGWMPSWERPFNVTTYAYPSGSGRAIGADLPQRLRSKALSLAELEELRRLRDRLQHTCGSFARTSGIPPLDIDFNDIFFDRVPRFLHARPAYASARDRVTPGGVACRKAHRVRRCSPRPWCGR